MPTSEAPPPPPAPAGGPPLPPSGGTPPGGCRPGGGTQRAPDPLQPELPGDEGGRGELPPAPQPLESPREQAKQRSAAHCDPSGGSLSPQCSPQRDRFARGAASLAAAAAAGDDGPGAAPGAERAQEPLAGSALADTLSRVVARYVSSTDGAAEAVRAFAVAVDSLRQTDPAAARGAMLAIAAACRNEGSRRRPNPGLQAARDLESQGSEDFLDGEDDEDDDVTRLLRKRMRLRQERNFPPADAIREEVSKYGVHWNEHLWWTADTVHVWNPHPDVGETTPPPELQQLMTPVEWAHFLQMREPKAVAVGQLPASQVLGFGGRDWGVCQGAADAAAQAAAHCFARGSRDVSVVWPQVTPCKSQKTLCRVEYTFQALLAPGKQREHHWLGLPKGGQSAPASSAGAAGSG
eukprot:TRINITY_DN60949_c0_g1_i2.p1 TRINITY_DN60949_c0_g1~~TRINITY_DN60949_c0_g1_i2.p1  ORF type:complete len:407 (+),score=103.26 TRINITY_DN60949_c0_g1_i2:21-1241(+)